MIVMSRGFGRVQVAILDALRERYDEHGRPELWLCISTSDLGLGEHCESRRRAAYQLAKAGHIELCRASSGVVSQSHRFYSTSVLRSLLFARLPYGPLHRAHTLEMRAEYEGWIGVFLDPRAEQRDRAEAAHWIRWYEQPEGKMTDLGDEPELIMVTMDKGGAGSS